MLTETARLDISFLPSRRVWIRVAERSTRTYGQVLIQAPLLRTGQTRLGRIVRRVQFQYSVVGREADTFG